MNKISWLLYIAELAQNFGALLFFAGTCFLVFYALGNFSILMNNGVLLKDEKPIPHIKKRFLVFSAAILFLAAIIPSKNTIYMIAASEMSHSSISIEKAGQLIDPTIALLKQKIDNALRDGAKP